MNCPKCGATIRSDAAACPFCAADTSPRAPAAGGAAPPPMGPSAPVAPTVAFQPVTPPPVQAYASVPMATPTGPPAKRSSPIVACAVIGCLGLLIVGGLGGFLAWKKFAPKLPVALTTGANKPPASATGAPGNTTGATGSAATDQSAPPAATTEEALNLDDFVGTWEFVGEPGPWGEGMPVKLERSGNLLIGEVEVPEMYDDRIKLKLSAGNGEVLGESTTIYKNEPPHANAVSMELNDSKNIITVKFRSDSGEWLMRVAEKKSGASPASSSSAAPSGQGDGLRSLIIAASKLRPPADGVQIETAGDWAFADVAEKDSKGSWATATSVVARRQSGRWSIVMVGDPMENRGITAQMPLDVRKAYGKWDAGHY